MNKKRVIEKLKFLYGKQKAIETYEEINRLIKTCEIKNEKEKWNEKDVFLVMYGNQIKSDKRGLETLGKVSKKYFSNFSTIHILPFFVSSGDRGFLVENYTKVDAKFGTWKDIKKIENNFNLMFDLVLNHVSSKHRWFKEFLKGNKKYGDYFIAYDKKPRHNEIEKVFRPRTSPLFSKYKTKNGEKYLWTTFSKNHIDLNYKNPKVLIEIIKILLTYIKNGASAIRLDSAGFIWKELGTTCMHLKQTHCIIQILREIHETVCEKIKLATETNVSHIENMSYFGNGLNEAKMVYNFTLPPLVLNAFYSGKSKELLNWLNTLKIPSNKTTMLNFLDSHDGVGLTGAKKIISQAQIKKLIKQAKKHDVVINYKSVEGGKEPYEITGTWFSLLNTNDEETEIANKKYIASRAIALAMKGIPFIYFHGLLGDKSNYKMYKKTKSGRDLNRADNKLKDFEKNLKNNEIWKKLNDLIKIRIKEKSFNPDAEQKVLFLNDCIFSIIRNEKILVLINVCNKKQKIKIPKKFNNGKCIITKRRAEKEMLLEPYEVLWIK